MNFQQAEGTYTIFVILYRASAAYMTWISAESWMSQEGVWMNSVWILMHSPRLRSMCVRVHFKARHTLALHILKLLFVAQTQKAHYQHPNILILYNSHIQGQRPDSNSQTPAHLFSYSSCEPQVRRLLNQYSAADPCDSINFQLTTSAPHNRH